MKIFMRLVLVILLVISLGQISTAEESSNDCVISLSSLNGLKNTIKGPMDEDVPVQFFLQDPNSIINYEEDYYTNFSLNRKSGAVLVLENPAYDGMPYPVVISVSRNDNFYRNYIVTFNDEGVLTIQFDGELEALSADYNKEVQLIEEQNNIVKKSIIQRKEISFKKKKDYDIVVFSSFPFDAELKIDSEDKNLFVSDPESDATVGILSYTGNGFIGCCLSTSGAKKSVLCIRDDTGAGYQMWVKIDRYESQSVLYDYYGILTSYYPTSSSPWHTPTTPYPTCDYSYGIGSPGTCWSAMGTFYTLISLPGGTASHKWWDMHNIVLGTGTGRIQTLTGPGAGRTWTLWNN